MSSTEEIDPTPPKAFGTRRGLRVVVGLLSVVMVLAGVGLVGRALAPDPTDDPCAAVPSGLVDEFFPSEQRATAIRMTLPDSSRQRCVWLPRAGNGVDFSTYRRVEVTFGLADRDAYLERMRSYADSPADPDSDLDSDPDSDAGNGPDGEANDQDAEQAGEQPDPLMVEIDESTDQATGYRLATVQRGRTEGDHDIVVELSATAATNGTNGPRPEELRGLLTSLAEQLRPLRESALDQSPDSDLWMLADSESVPLGKLLTNGFSLADPAECARVPSDLLHDILGEHSRSPVEAGCVWQSETTGSEYETVLVRLGTADDPVTARDAYAEFSFATDPASYVIADRHRTRVGELGGRVRSRVLVGTYSLMGSTAMANARIAEVTATDGRSVVAVQYVATNAPDSENAGATPSPDRAERAALDLAEALLTHP